jgi:hypothetical protein
MVRVLLAAGCLLLISSPSTFADLFWGANGAGGSGTWNTTNQNWFDGTQNVAWRISDSGAIFGGTGGTVTIGRSGLMVDHLTFATSGYSFEGNALEASAAGLTITTNADTAFNASVYAGIGISGRTVRKDGAAALILSGFYGFDLVQVEAGEIRTQAATPRLGFSTTAPTTLTLTGGSASVGGLQGGSPATSVMPYTSAAGGQTLSLSNSAGSFAGVLRDHGANRLGLTLNAGTQEPHRRQYLLGSDVGLWGDALLRRFWLGPEYVDHQHQRRHPSPR